MEKLLFCATCGQQFFGIHQPNGSTHTPDTTHPTDTTQPTVCGIEECTEQRPPAGSAHPTDYTHQLSRPYQ
jgi:hypothetical protein